MTNIFSGKFSNYYEKIKVEKKLNYHFDVEFCQESISGNHKCNGALSLIRERLF